MVDPDDMVRGMPSAVSPLVCDLFRDDTRELPPGLKATGHYQPLGSSIPFRRYFDPAYAALEREHIWLKQWQFACREEDLPEIGDRLPYNVGMLSYIIVRSGPSEFKAFYNSCLHRGTKLCEGHSSGDSFRCPFHAWEWKLDGGLKNIPSRWDFDQVDSQAYRLPEARVSNWGGFIFINPDSNAAPLESVLGVLPEHFKDCPTEQRFTAFHIHKKVRANWKVVMEAFLEAYHVIETHADSMGFTGDASTQYDIWDDSESHISRLITPLAVPSPHLGETTTAGDAANDAFIAFGMAMPGIPVPSFDPQSKLSARAQVAEWRRQALGLALGGDLSSWPDTAMIDSIQYHMFPNFCPWYGEGLPLIYQFLPLGDNPDESLFCVRLTLPLPTGAPRPPVAPIQYLHFDEGFHKVPEIGVLARIFDQDMSNLPRVQEGLKAASPSHARMTLGRYQESRIQYFHEVLTQIVGE
jgi:phenylpropionate dioxygenase-like ring-hydroxylating dioxygenase large terminal subunit